MQSANQSASESVNVSVNVNVNEIARKRHYEVTNEIVQMKSNYKVNSPVNRPMSKQSQSPAANPVLVEVHRGGQVESRHRGAAVAIDADGEMLFACGAVDAPVYPRSSLKMFQAIPLIESGAADAANLSADEITLACASHSGEEVHRNAVEKWLTRVNLHVDDLECGKALPMSASAKRAHLQNGGAPLRALNTCSGKHAGMLTLAKFLDAPTRGYSDYDHPTQRIWMTAFGELTDSNPLEFSWERDGCGLPALCMPLTTLARGFAAFGAPQKFAEPRARAMTTLLESIPRAPLMLAGHGRCCTDVVAASDGQVIVKTGAEGVYAGVAPQRAIGFALKIDDGATRAAEVALGALLAQLALLSHPQCAQLQTHFAPVIHNSNGDHTGHIAPTDWRAIST